VRYKAEGLRRNSKAEASPSAITRKFPAKGPGKSSALLSPAFHDFIVAVC